MPRERKSPLPTHARVRELLHYEKKTGLFRRIARGSSNNRSEIGGITGWLDRNGYWYVTIDGMTVTGGPLAVFWVTGRWPIEVDHKNLNKADNRWRNLRECTRSQNCMHARSKITNTNGHRGVHLHRACKSRPYHARIMVRGKDINLGYFATAEEAGAAYRAAQAKLHGEFAYTEPQAHQ